MGAQLGRAIQTSFGLVVVAIGVIAPIQRASGAQGMPTPLETCESGKLEVQFLGVQSGRSPRDLRSPATGKEPRWTRCDLQLRWADAPTRLWLPQGVLFQNARGEVWRPTQTAVYFRPSGVGSFSFPDPPAQFQGPCKLKLELARSARYLPYEFWEAFGPDELWNVPLLPVPSPKAALPMKTYAAEVVRGGVHLRLVQVVGAQATSPFRKTMRPARPSLQVRYSPALPALNVTLVRATDFGGRSIALAGAPVPSPVTKTAAERSVLFPMLPRRDSRVLNATFAVHQSRFVELSFPAVTEPVRSGPLAIQRARGAATRDVKAAFRD